MNMPGFTAEASLVNVEQHYRGSKIQLGFAGAGTVTPQQNYQIDYEVSPYLPDYSQYFRPHWCCKLIPKRAGGYFEFVCHWNLGYCQAEYSL